MGRFLFYSYNEGAYGLYVVGNAGGTNYIVTSGSEAWYFLNQGLNPPASAYPSPAGYLPHPFYPQPPPHPACMAAPYPSFYAPGSPMGPVFMLPPQPVPLYAGPVFVSGPQLALTDRRDLPTSVNSADEIQTLPEPVPTTVLPFISTPSSSNTDTPVSESMSKEVDPDLPPTTTLQPCTDSQPQQEVTVSLETETSSSSCADNASPETTSEKIQPDKTLEETLTPQLTTVADQPDPVTSRASSTSSTLRAAPAPSLTTSALPGTNSPAQQATSVSLNSQPSSTSCNDQSGTGITLPKATTPKATTPEATTPEATTPEATTEELQPDKTVSPTPNSQIIPINLSNPVMSKPSQQSSVSSKNQKVSGNKATVTVDPTTHLLPAPSASQKSKTGLSTRPEQTLKASASGNADGIQPSSTQSYTSQDLSQRTGKSGITISGSSQQKDASFASVTSSEPVQLTPSPAMAEKTKAETVRNSQSVVSPDKLKASPARQRSRKRNNNKNSRQAGNNKADSPVSARAETKPDARSRLIATGLIAALTEPPRQVCQHLISAAGRGITNAASFVGKSEKKKQNIVREKALRNIRASTGKGVSPNRSYPLLTVVKVTGIFMGAVAIWMGYRHLSNRRLELQPEPDDTSGADRAEKSCPESISDPVIRKACNKARELNRPEVVKLIRALGEHHANHHYPAMGLLDQNNHKQLVTAPLDVDTECTGLEYSMVGYTSHFHGASGTPVFDLKKSLYADLLVTSTVVLSKRLDGHLLTPESLDMALIWCGFPVNEVAAKAQKECLVWFADQFNREGEGWYNRGVHNLYQRLQRHHVLLKQEPALSFLPGFPLSPRCRLQDINYEPRVLKPSPLKGEYLDIPLQNHSDEATDIELKTLPENFRLQVYQGGNQWQEQAYNRVQGTGTLIEVKTGLIYRIIPSEPYVSERFFAFNNGVLIESPSLSESSLLLSSGMNRHLLRQTMQQLPPMAEAEPEPELPAAPAYKLKTSWPLPNRVAIISGIVIGGGIGIYLQSWLSLNGLGVMLGLNALYAGAEIMAILKYPLCQGPTFLKLIREVIL